MTTLPRRVNVPLLNLGLGLLMAGNAGDAAA